MVITPIIEKAIGKGSKNPIVSAPTSLRTSFASKGAVLPASVAVPPINPPVARVRYVFFFVIFPFDDAATVDINGIIIATNAAFVINIDKTAENKNTNITNLFSDLPTNLFITEPIFPPTPLSRSESIMITIPITRRFYKKNC